MSKKISYFVFAVFDILIIFGFSFLSFFLNYSYDYFKHIFLWVVLYCGSLSLLTVILFVVLKLYKISYLNFGLADSIRVLIGFIIPSFIGLVSFIFIKEFKFNLKLFLCWLFDCLAVLLLLTIIRAMPREFNSFKVIISKKNLTRTLIIGAGGAAKMVIEDSLSNKNATNNIVVILDDDTRKIGSFLLNVKVEGPISNISFFIKKYEIHEVIISIANLSRNRLHEILGYLKNERVRVRRMPTLSEMSGPNDIRIIDVDIDDLLERDPITLDNSEINNMISGSTVLVTGAGGSIGSELVRQIFKANPAKLILFDIYENSTYSIQQELLEKIRKNSNFKIEVITLIGSTYNEKRVEQIMKQYLPDYVYHAAAYKHVPLMEDSPIEAIRTNVIGTYNVAKLCNKYEIKKMVLVSTDKAVRPTNTMGATKRFAEYIIQYFSNISLKTAYAAVRFGNVLGSNGSVVPLFKKQIENGGPITLTHRDIIRYFMTIPEAVSLILQCGIYAKGGEIFILDMGKPVKIYDLAVKLIRQAGLVPDKDIKIVETGLRPGEKLFEELLLDKSVQLKTSNDRIFVEKKGNIMQIDAEIEKISKAFELDSNIEIKKLLKTTVSSYSIFEGGD